MNTIKPLLLNNEFVQFIMKKDCSHACSKISNGYCPFEKNDDKRSGTTEAYCEGLKKIMEEYDNYRKGKLYADYFYIQSLIKKFESHYVSVTIFKCCSSFRINEGNHRLCIAKKTNTPVYGIVSKRKTCEYIERNLLKRLVKRFIAQKKLLSIHPYTSMQIPVTTEINTTSTHTKLLDKLNYFTQVLLFYNQKAELFRNQPIEHPHELSYAELKALENIHCHLETILYNLRYGEAEEKLEKEEISSTIYDELIEKISSEKPYG